MNIKDLKDLKKLIALCQSQGVRAIEVDNIKLELNELVKEPRRMRQVSEPTALIGPSIDETVGIPQMDIPTDELSAEDLLFYSSNENTN